MSLNIDWYSIFTLKYKLVIYIYWFVWGIEENSRKYKTRYMRTYSYFWYIFMLLIGCELTRIWKNQKELPKVSFPEPNIEDMFQWMFQNYTSSLLRCFRVIKLLLSHHFWSIQSRRKNVFSADPFSELALVPKIATIWIIRGF